MAAGFLDPAPRNFTGLNPEERSRDAMVSAVSRGVDGTAMQAFADRLDQGQIDAVVDYIRIAFMRHKSENMRYHSPANGWFDHQVRNGQAYPFVLGRLSLDMPVDQMTPDQRAGRLLYLSSCITCHDRKDQGSGVARWDASAVSYPRGGYDHRLKGRPERTDAVSSATPYRLHDRPPVLTDLSAGERRGERLFQENCAFCHAADGTGKGWIGRFLRRHPRNLTDVSAMRYLDRTGLAAVIRDGIPGTTMSAWGRVLSEGEIADVTDYVLRAFRPFRRE